MISNVRLVSLHLSLSPSSSIPYNCQPLLQLMVTQGGQLGWTNQFHRLELSKVLKYNMGRADCVSVCRDFLLNAHTTLLC